MFGAEGFVLQKIEGDGKVFIYPYRTVIDRTLQNETLRVDTGYVVAFELHLEFDIESTGSLKSMVFGEEELFPATLHGTGNVRLQSLPIRKLKRAVSRAGGNEHKEANSIWEFS